MKIAGGYQVGTMASVAHLSRSCSSNKFSSPEQIQLSRTQAKARK